MPIFMDPSPISTNLEILGFPIFVPRDYGPWILEFSGSGVIKAITSKTSPLGVNIFKNDTPLDFKSKEVQDFPKHLQIIYCLS